MPAPRRRDTPVRRNERTACPSRSIASGVASEPSATASAVRLSFAPNTRASTSSGTSRAGSVWSPMSTSTLPTPITTISAITAIGFGNTPMRLSDRPQMATPTPSRAASRRPVTNTVDPRDPATAPAPTAAVNRPTPGAPSPRTSNAMTTTNTLKQPRVTDCTSASPMSRLASRCRASARNPSTVSCAIRRKGAAGPRGGGS